MKYKIISMILASSMTAGSFTMPAGGLFSGEDLPQTGLIRESDVLLPAGGDIAENDDYSGQETGPAGSAENEGELFSGDVSIQDIQEDIPSPVQEESSITDAQEDVPLPDTMDEDLLMDNNGEDLLIDNNGEALLDNNDEDLLIDTQEDLLIDADGDEVLLDVQEEDLLSESPADEVLFEDALPEEEEALSAGNSLLEEDAEDLAADEKKEDPTDEEEWGGYEFAGYLEDNIPNFVWKGNGEPSTIGHEVVFSDGEAVEPPKVRQMLLASPPSATQGGNYLINTPSRTTYHPYTKMSDTVQSAYADGLHTESNGKVRAYRNGKYFIDGGISLDGKSYYADENGYLIQGWLKTCNDSSVTNPSGIADDTKFTYRFFDRTTCERVENKFLRIDGLGHYFGTTGGLYRNDPVTINGNYYFSDRYGICERVKLRYGNVISSEAVQNNDAYLAKNSVQAVDMNTFTGQKGEYSFRPKWYSGVTKLELFGFTPSQTGSAYYCTIRDDSLKGKIGCIYRNVGTYQGKEIDLKLTITDYELFSLNGDTEVGYFYVVNNAIGLNNCNTKTITADMQFLDHSTQTPVTLKGYATFSDIDISQCISFLSPVDEVYVDKSCVLYKDPASMTFTAPFDSARMGSLINDSDSRYWVQVNYTGDHFKFRFGSPYVEYEFYDSGTDITTASMVWNKNYTGNPADYYIMNSDTTMKRSWQGIHYRRLGRISIPPVNKTVSDKDQKDVTDNRLAEDELTYDYTLHHNVPAESEDFYYSSYKVTDDFEEGLSVQQGSITVTNDANADVTSLFDIKVTGRKVEISARSQVLSQASFYDSTYHFHVPVKINDLASLPRRDGDDFLIYNTCKVEFNRSAGAESSTSNRTSTRIKEPFYFGSITITKRIAAKDIVWAHGNPTFMFSAEGTDTRKVRHRYEEFLCFQKENLNVDKEGWAVLSVTIDHVPIGTYNVCEMGVIDYYLTGAQAQTSNMRIVNVSAPGRGKDPASVMYGTCTLTREAPNAAIAFTDAKGDWHGDRHTDVVKNNIPVKFG